MKVSTAYILNKLGALVKNPSAHDPLSSSNKEIRELKPQLLPSQSPQQSMSAHMADCLNQAAQKDSKQSPS